jgi:hypothetical protein
MSNMNPLMIVAEFSLPLGVLAVTVTVNVTTCDCDCDWSPATVTGTPQVVRLGVRPQLHIVYPNPNEKTKITK